MHHQLAVLPDGGSIVNIVSTAGISAAPGMAAYVAAKHAVVGLTRTAAIDYADRGIRVNAVAPGPIDSGGVAAQSDEIKQRIGSFVPLGRLGRPDEVAAAVTWLASPTAAYTTGAILTVDGGKGARGA
jgi:NAD(P)-dependent dehydrogenase (short-subunit alcohol dehydrogenase family)